MTIDSFGARLQAVTPFWPPSAFLAAAVVLPVLGLTGGLWKGNRFVYPFVVAGTGVVSCLYALDTAQVPPGVLSDLCSKLPLYEQGFCWVSVALVMLVLSMVLSPVSKLLSGKKVALHK